MQKRPACVRSGGPCDQFRAFCLIYGTHSPFHCHRCFLYDYRLTSQVLSQTCSTMPTVCFEHVFVPSMAACLLRLDASNSDDRCTWKSLWVGLIAFNDLPLLTSLKILASNAIDQALCPKLKEHSQRLRAQQLDPEYHHDSMRCLIEYMLANSNPSLRRYLDAGAHHGERDNCFIKFLVRTVYEVRGFPHLADW